MNDPSVLDDRRELRALLWDACELEHQLMLQYLFAAFTLKKFEDDSCTRDQLEAIRRWGSTIMVVARQEMEHLALANGILSAIGEDPFFPRDNIPLRSRYFLGEHRAKAAAAAAEEAGGVDPGPTPKDIEFRWEKFNRDTMARFVCAESPDWRHVQGTAMYPSWCFADPAADPALRLSAASGQAPLKLSRSHVDELVRAVSSKGLFASIPVHPGAIQELYGKIDALLKKHPEYFKGVPDRQVFIPVEYQISVIKITDYVSASAAIDQIVEEGEGIETPPDYESHFARFWGVYQELLQMLPTGFDPALPVAMNPLPDESWIPYTRAVSELLDDAYVVLLYVLTSLYRNYGGRDRPPYLTEALQNVAFGPFMTMIVRPVAEVLVHLRIHEGGTETAGPVFQLTDEQEERIWPRPSLPDVPGAGLVPGRPGSHRTEEEREAITGELDDIDFILGRMDALCRRLAELSGEANDAESAELVSQLSTALVEQADEGWARGRLAYVRESAEAMANNVRRIYQVGQLPQFNVQVEWPL
ncbi:ferritin-like domain-containing protein [Longimicrobium sp.]|uniref:ferritin-like domain-containing protein n=1 Tax=Longimicrobium sp. TaxID=2029185 RepID=UPI002E365C13|nr:ferritin-like domain-containing protein [Longimicrobium sp.]HEX6041582.1 ferritin-like domain-containing protein [Longimicrobium sp.]